jgi:hypothetical protein
VSAWTVLTAAKVLASLPTDLNTLYLAWIDANPAKAGRLAEITDQFVEMFRQAAGANPACAVDEDLTTVPTVAYHHALNMIVFSLGMEMGVQFAPEVYSLNTQANIWLRMAPTSRIDLTGTAAVAGKPSYRWLNPCTGEYES